jgi:hypothetical protein
VQVLTLLDCLKEFAKVLPFTCFTSTKEQILVTSTKVQILTPETPREGPSAAFKNAAEACELAFSKSDADVC